MVAPGKNFRGSHELRRGFLSRCGPCAWRFPRPRPAMEGVELAAEIEVAIGVLSEVRDGRASVLIARRRSDSVLGGFWEFPGGKREAGESLTQCLAREFREELGLEIAVTGTLEPIEHDYAHGRVRLVPFHCRRVSGEPRNLRVSEHRWVAPSQLADYQFPPANRDLLAHLARSLGCT